MSVMICILKVVEQNISFLIVFLKDIFGDLKDVLTI